MRQGAGAAKCGYHKCFGSGKVILGPENMFWTQTTHFGTCITLFGHNPFFFDPKFFSSRKHASLSPIMRLRSARGRGGGLRGEGGG